MCVLQLFLSVDPSLGRLDYSLLSDQALMEIFMEGFGDDIKNRYKDIHGMYRDVCEWLGIQCNDDQRITQIGIISKCVSGSLELCYLPPKVNLLGICSWGESKLTGSVGLTQLPEEMTELFLEENQLTGEIDLTHLPKGMRKLSLEKNQLTGEINLAHLPDGMNALDLSSNQLFGEIDLTHLPVGMDELFLNNNLLTGSLVIKKLPQGMKMINVRGNQFNAIAVVDLEVHITIKLTGSGVTRNFYRGLTVSWAIL